MEKMLYHYRERNPDSLFAVNKYSDPGKLYARIEEGEYADIYILDILFPAGTDSSRRASPSSISPLRALHNGVKRGDGEGAAAAPSFKDDLGNVALGKKFL